MVPTKTYNPENEFVINTDHLSSYEKQIFNSNFDSFLKKIKLLIRVECIDKATEEYDTLCVDLFEEFRVEIPEGKYQELYGSNKNEIDSETVSIQIDKKNLGICQIEKNKKSVFCKNIALLVYVVSFALLLSFGRETLKKHFIDLIGRVSNLYNRGKKYASYSK